MNPVEVAAVPAPNLREPLRLLEGWLREGEPVPDEFVEEIQRHVEAGDLEVLAAHLKGRMVGVLVLAFRPNISLGARFASIEDLYVLPESRHRGVGGNLLKAAGERCRERGISYVEAQVEEDVVDRFYGAFGYEAEAGVRVFSASLAPGSGSGERDET